MCKIKIVLKNRTDFEVVFSIGEKTYTIPANKTTKITAEKQVSIEARPTIIGVNSSFILGGLKRNTILDCTVGKSIDGFKHKLILNTLKLKNYRNVFS